MKKLICSVLLFAIAFAAAAQTSAKPTPGELAGFFDQVVPELMEEYHVAGAVVGVADSVQVLFLRGYGSADLETGRPVDPEQTLFRPGSITKLLTWTAVMQLEEQGKLRLDDPVEQYLDFALPDTFAEPIRLIDLMNHTPGFEDRMIGLMVHDPRYQVTLKQAVSRDIPRRVRPPGQEVSYSNYGTMLAGYVVERISGMPYEEYVQRNILDPLGMDRSTVQQPPPPALAEKLTRGYAYHDEKYVPQKFEIVNGAPAGALSATAPDMLRFYRAYLNGGQLDGRRILQEQTVRKMQEPSFRQDPRANGIAHGFIEFRRGDIKGFGHGGDTIYFHSDSGYLPEQDLAYFVSTNSASGSQLILELMERMLDRFFPVPTGSELAADAGLNPDLKEYTGIFSMDRRPESDPTQLLGGFTLIGPKVSEDSRGLQIASIVDPEGSVYLPVARDIFQQKDGSMRVVFLRDDRGRVQSLYADDIPVFLFSRPPWIELPVVSIIVLALGVLFLLSGAIAPPTGLLTVIPRLRSRVGLEGGRASRLFALWSARAYVLLVLLQGAVIASLGDIFFVPVGPAHMIPLYLGVAAVVVTLAAVGLAWRKKLFRALGRVHYTVFAVSQVLFVAWLGYWGFFFV